MRNLALATFLSVLLCLSTKAEAEPANFEFRNNQTIIYLDIYNRSWLPINEIETTLYFYNSTGDLCYQELIYISFETPIRPQHHNEILITTRNLSHLQPIRIEANYRY